MSLDPSLVRLLSIVGATIAAHMLALGIRSAGRRFLRSKHKSETKIATLTGFGTSSLVFIIYFSAAGFVLTELGVPLTTYVAGASVIGLAVSFGSQGVVQDVITGISLVLSDLIDVGDMVEIGGQVGIVHDVQMRFTVLLSYTGARIYIPNRSITSVVNHRSGAVRAFLDVLLPSDENLRPDAEAAVIALVSAAHEQFPGTVLTSPEVLPVRELPGGKPVLRHVFRMWPGQVSLLEGPIRARVITALKIVDPNAHDWQVVVHYRSETGLSGEPLPLPRALVAGEA